jgi:hypothetical protein
VTNSFLGNQCQPGFWSFPECQVCQCNDHASICEQKTGACIECRDLTTGHNCDRLVVSDYVYILNVLDAKMDIMVIHVWVSVLHASRVHVQAVPALAINMPIRAICNPVANRVHKMLFAIVDKAIRVCLNDSKLCIIFM